MERWDIYDIKRAVKLYLGTEEKINWETDCIIKNGVIVEWNITSKEKPTTLQLNEAWFSGKLEYFKQLQKVVINQEFNHILKNGRSGCVTSIIGNNGEPIVVDDRRGGDHDDYANFRMGVDLVKYTGMPKLIVKDYYNNQHEIDSEHMETIYKELLIHGVEFLSIKWAKIEEIEASTEVEAVVKITMYGE